jgi:hypothetical protein
MPPQPFTIKLGDGNKRVTIETLTQALENALAMLRSVGRDFAPGGVEVRWEVVGASLRSPLTLSFAPRIPGPARDTNRLAKQISTACLNGIGQLEARAESPPHFDDDALRAAQSLIKMAQRENVKLTVATDKKHEVTPTARAVENINQVAARARIYVDEGTVEGMLQEICVRGGVSVAVWDDLTDHRVECVIDPNRLQEAKDLLGKRVAVSGRIRYRNHKPTTIQVEAIRVLRDMGEILKLEDIPPLNITDGIPSEDYVRKLRDAQ